MKTHWIIVLVLGLFSMLSPRAEAQLTIANNGKSTFTIVLPDKAPASVKAAAQELQRDIAQSTGATLPLKKDSEEIIGSFISLGATRQAASVDITTEGIADEGFRIQTHQNNIYILGPDTAALISSPWRLRYNGYEEQPDIPGSQHTKDGGFSNGTANGVYTFLEDYLGVRWLMPGDIGRDVPIKSTFVVPDISRDVSPLFSYRLLALAAPSGNLYPPIAEWGFRQKLGFSFNLQHDHNWVQTVGADLYEKHPDWFALVNGKRQVPVGQYKLETTNPEVVQYFADKAVEALKANKRPETYSLSPSDGRGWSESPASKALYDPPPPGSEFPSITPLILKWYKDVSEIVAKEDPQGKLAGYIYTDFSHPPLQGSMKLPENFIPVIVGQGFGYRYYRPEVRKEAKSLMNAWAKVAPSTWFYYGMPVWLRSSTGMLTTASPDNLNFLFTLLRENHIKGAVLYGTPVWSQTAMANYIEAKMLWDPTLDAHNVQHDWLMHAYGAKAGGVMEQLYDKMDNGAFADYFRQDPSQHYNVRELMFKDYFGPHYPEIEKYFLQANAQPMTPLQKQRLQLIGDNLIVLQWRLRNAGYLPADFVSPLRRTDKQVADLLLAKHEDFDHFPDTVYQKRIGTTKVQLEQSSEAPSKTAPLPNPNRILIYASKAQDIPLTFTNVHPGSSFLSYLISSAATGKELQSGIVYSDETVVIKAKANNAYYLTVTSSGVRDPEVKWDMTVATATLAQASYQKEVVLLHGKKAAPIYVYIPSSFSQEVHQDANEVTLRSPLTAQEAILKDYPNAKTVQELNNDWRFNPDPKKSGLEQGFAKSDFNDQTWKTVTTTDHWQKQGFPEYHGTAWYRKNFESPQTNSDDPQGVIAQRILLFFGGVDGDAVVYLNGEKVGEHLLGPKYRGWDEPFVIDITKEIKPGNNTVAVKVTKDDVSVAGGIWKGVSLQLQEK